MTDRRAHYKNFGLDSKELRRRREEDCVQLRKQKRDDFLSKKRTMAPQNTEDDMIQSLSENKLDLSDSVQDLSMTQEVVDALMQNEDQQLLIEAAQKVRKLLSKEPLQPFDEVLQSGLVPRFVELLDRRDNTFIQFEVAWIITNICSGTSEQTRAIVEHNAVPKLINLLNSPDMKVCEQAVWALGNIIGDCAEFRDIVLQHNFVPALLALIRPDLDLNFLRNETWVLVNICRTKYPPPSLETVQQLLPALSFLLQSTDLAILIDSTWTISYITELGAEYSQLIIDSGLINQVTPLLIHEEMKIQTAAIRALGSIVTGNEEQTQAVIDAGALPHLKILLKENKDRIVKEALWFLSNITAGSTSQIQAIIDNQLIPSIIFHLDYGDFNQQKEAAWVVYNMIISGESQQIQVLLKNKILPPLCNMLNLKDTSVIRNVLDSLNSILKMCWETNPEIFDILESCGGCDKIETLQQSSNPEILNLAYSIMDFVVKHGEDT